MKRKQLDILYRNRFDRIKTVREWIVRYVPIMHTPKIINDGISAKKREIIVPTVKEHVVQHAVMNILKPILIKPMYQHSYSSIPGRGCHKGMKIVKRWIAKGGSDIKYCLKMDIKQFFPSINISILLNKINRIIKDEKFNVLLLQILSTAKGLPLGFYTSQWFSNFYLTEFDHFIKEKLRIKYYVRYADDIVVFNSNKHILHRMFEAIRDYLKIKLDLNVKENWQIFRFHTKTNKGRFLDFMGFRFYRNRTTIRRRIAIKAMRKAKRIYKKQIPTICDARQMLSYLGWTKVTNTYIWFQNYILAYVNIKQLRKIVSLYDKRRYHNEYVATV